MSHTMFFLGMVMLQIIFVTYQYILFKRKEFLYYLLYTFCIAIFIFFKSFPQYNPATFMVIPDEPFTPARSVLLTGYAMYYRFGRYFTETRVLYLKLNNQLKIVEWIFLTFSAIDVALLCSGVNFHVLEPISQKIYLAAIPFSIYAIIYLITRRQPLTSIYVIGSGLLLAFAAAGFIDRIFISQRSHPESYYLIFIEIGIVCEFLFLNYGLIYKTRMLQKENMRLEVEKQVALYKQRMQISSDLHDEVGATLSGIAMYSQITKEQIKQQETQNVEQSLSMMQQSAATMVDKLSDIVWTVNPREDSLQQLFQRLEEYAREMCFVKNITVNTSISNNLAEIKIPMEERRNFYLLCKEAINNAVKYSQCSELKLSVYYCDNKINFLVEDDGVGFDISTVKLGNGINNMRRRAEESGALLEINSEKDKGTSLHLSKITSLG